MTRPKRHWREATAQFPLLFDLHFSLLNGEEYMTLWCCVGYEYIGWVLDVSRCVVVRTHMMGKLVVQLGWRQEG